MPGTPPPATLGPPGTPPPARAGPPGTPPPARPGTPPPAPFGFLRGLRSLLLVSFFFGITLLLSGWRDSARSPRACAVPPAASTNRQRLVTAVGSPPGELSAGADRARRAIRRPGG